MAATPQIRRFQEDLNDTLAQQVGVTTTTTRSCSLINYAQNPNQYAVLHGAHSQPLDLRAQPVVNLIGMQGAAHPIEADYHAWLLHQASLLRGQQLGLLDWSNLAEELEAMAAQDRRTMRKQLQRLLSHLLKYWAQPEATEHHESWRRSIRNAREEIGDLLKESPGIFQGKEDEVLAEAYKRAREDASDETKLPLRRFPEYGLWTLTQVLTDENLVPRRYDTDNPA